MRLSKTWMKTLRSLINSQMVVSKTIESRARAANASIIKKVRTVILLEKQNHMFSMMSKRECKISYNRTKHFGMLRPLIISKLHILILMKKRQNNNIASLQCRPNMVYLAGCNRLIKSLNKHQEKNQNK